MDDAAIMTSYVYRSAFSTDSSETTSSALPATGPVTPAGTNEQGQQLPNSRKGGFASFICHVAYLEDSIRSGEKTTFFAWDRTKTTTRTRLGYGTSFLVDRAEVLHEGEGPADESSSSISKPKYVVVKTVREDPRNPNQWRDVLFEIRVLLHQPIRYHPNIVRLLDVGWDASSETGSLFPSLIQEYAEFGTLDKLQNNNASLPFSIKQKLCYDVGRGISILHACGIVHGDLKHENILVFANRYSNPSGQPYTAKVADFGGTIMDMRDTNTTHSVPMNTFPYEAPEIGQKLSVEGVKKTDAFSYGMLIWRCMLDCDDLLTTIGFSTVSARPAEQERGALNRLKTTDELLEKAIASLSRHNATRNLPAISLGLVITSLMFTLRGDPNHRALDRAQARMRGMSASDSFMYVDIKDKANAKMLEGLKHRIPGRHGMDIDSVGYALGRLVGDNYDAQNNLPGYRPDLPHPEAGGFLFEPLRLRRLLDWNQQKDMVNEFIAAAQSQHQGESSSEMEPWSAAFFLYQSYLSGFGVKFDPVQACYWLRQAANPSEEAATVDYLAKAWLVRVHSALGVTNPLSTQEQIDSLWWSLIRGHRHCAEDSRLIISASPDAEQRENWEFSMKEAEWNYRRRTGATGMPYFISRKLTRKWDAEDVAILDQEIRNELGDEYESCLRPKSPNSTTIIKDDPPDSGYRFDRIYVNHKGHGLLHLAASLGNVNVLRHLYSKYKCNIDLSNQSHSETPLTCACRSGYYECAMFLLDNGADPNGTEFGEESPLHCIANFRESEMDSLVKRLLEAGADIEKHTSASRKDVRRILADWEDNYSMTLTPLGRAVLIQSLPAVKILMKYGADPWLRKMYKNRSNVQPMELAAVLTLPDILQFMLSEDEKVTDVDAPQLFDECGLLEKARSEGITPYDPLSLQSRLVRCGSQFKQSLFRTLQMLKSRRFNLGLPADEIVAGAQLCVEVTHGNKDIVEALLDLGHPIDGSPGYRPIEAAVAANNEDIVRLLIDRGASLEFPIETCSHASLFSSLAARPRYTPRGAGIADLLINTGVKPNSTTASVPCPLAIAVRNGYFDLANKLIAHTSSEDINQFHAWADNGDARSILGILLESHTYASLEGIEYLANVYKNALLELAIHPLVNQTTGLSAIHTLAQTSASGWNHHSQISARIIQHVLEIFPAPESLRDSHIHPVKGTPLSAAILADNLHMVNTLLDSAYSEDIDKRVGIQYRVSHSVFGEDLTPRELSLKLTQGLVTDLMSRQDTVTREDISNLRNRVNIAMSLLALNDSTASSETPDPGTLDAMRRGFDMVLQRLEGAIKTRSNEAQAPGARLPVDLAIISEEKPTNWQEGMEMNSEMAMRTFLKSFRSDEGVFGDPIVVLMDKTFNKRPPALQPMRAANAANSEPDKS